MKEILTVMGSVHAQSEEIPVDAKIVLGCENFSDTCSNTFCLSRSAFYEMARFRHTKSNLGDNFVIINNADKSLLLNIPLPKKDTEQAKEISKNFIKQLQMLVDNNCAACQTIRKFKERS